MARKNLSEEKLRMILVQSRRRCCMCYGLNRDTSIKQGQIAHIDRNSQNDEIDNLAFLCLEHHDQYDSRTSQSKGFLEQEIRQYRDELHKHVSATFQNPTEATTLENIQGHYIREGFNESAEVKVWLISSNTYHVEIFALWGLDREYGPRTGDLEFDAELIDSKLCFSTELHEEKYDLSMEFKNDGLVVVEQGFCPFAGMNVRFDGTYAKAA